MKTLLFLFLLIFPFTIYSQNVSPEVLSSAGGTLSNSQYMVDWTVGEPVIETVLGSTHILTQGFHQPDFFITSIKETHDYSILVYPNPASSVLMIQTDIQQPLQASLYDLNGKILNEIRFTESTEFNISNLSRSVYLLKITDQKKHIIKIVKITKTH